MLAAVLTWPQAACTAASRSTFRRSC